MIVVTNLKRDVDTSLAYEIRHASRLFRGEQKQAVVEKNLCMRRFIPGGAATNMAPRDRTP